MRRRYNKRNLFNQTLKKIANQTAQFHSFTLKITSGIVTNLLPRVARLATGSGGLEKVFWEFYWVHIYQVAHNSYKFVVIDTPPASIYVILKNMHFQKHMLW